MHALVVTNAYPTAEMPGLGAFVAAQVESLRECGLGVDVLQVDRAGRGMGVYRSLGRRLQHAVTDKQPDVVHAMYGGVMAEIVTKTVREQPVLVSFCGSDVLGAQASAGLAAIAQRAGIWCSKRAAKRAAGVVVKSRNLLAALPQEVDPARTWLLPNGVDLALFRPLDQETCRLRLGLVPDSRHVLFPAAPLRPEKRFALARAAVDALGRPVQLHTLADRPQDEVPIWLNAADVVILTSEYEGSPNAIKEALACNVPIVAVDVGDVRERISGVDGCFIAEPSPGDLADKLRLALESPPRTNGRTRVAELSHERVAATLAGIYSRLVDDRRAA